VHESVRARPTSYLFVHDCGTHDASLSCVSQLRESRNEAIARSWIRGTAGGIFGGDLRRARDSQRRSAANRVNLYPTSRDNFAVVVGGTVYRLTGIRDASGTVKHLRARVTVLTRISDE
jgi:hypothetical protein